MRVLIVDDSALMRKVTHLAFGWKKYELEEADSGYGALAQLSLAQQPFDVKSALAGYLWVNLDGKGRHVKAGHFEVEGPSSAAESDP